MITREKKETKMYWSTPRYRKRYPTEQEDIEQ